MFSATLPISIGAVARFRNLHRTNRQKELGARLPPSIPSKSFGGLDILKSLRWEYHFGYLGDYCLGCEIFPQYKHENLSRRNCE